MLSVDAVFAHYLGVFLGLFAVVFILLDIRIIMHTNWDVFTSRIFLRKNESMQSVTRITLFLSAAIILLLVNHLLTIWQYDLALIGTLQMAATGCLSIAMLHAFLLKRELSKSSEDENGTEQ